jgi:hypothetical protein
MVYPPVADRGYSFQTWRVAVNILKLILDRQQEVVLQLQGWAQASYLWEGQYLWPILK